MKSTYRQGRVRQLPNTLMVVGDEGNILITLVGWVGVGIGGGGTGLKLRGIHIGEGDCVK
jgi:hypothetical protein